MVPIKQLSELIISRCVYVCVRVCTCACVCVCVCVIVKLLCLSGLYSISGVFPPLPILFQWSKVATEHCQFKFYISPEIGG